VEFKVGELLAVLIWPLSLVFEVCARQRLLDFTVKDVDHCGSQHSPNLLAQREVRLVQAARTWARP